MKPYIKLLLAAEPDSPAKMTFDLVFKSTPPRVPEGILECARAWGCEVDMSPGQDKCCTLTVQGKTADVSFLDLLIMDWLYGGDMLSAERK